MGKLNVSIGDKVLVRRTHKSKHYLDVVGKLGVVVNTFYNSHSAAYDITVLIDDVLNEKSANGYFYFNPNELEVVKSTTDKCTFNFAFTQVAQCLYESKRIGIAIPDHFGNVADGSYIVAIVSDEPTLLCVDDVVDVSVNTTPITGEVCAVVDMCMYEMYKVKQVRKQQCEQEIAALTADIETEVENLKKLDTYTHYATTFSEKSPELQGMVDKLKALKDELANI